jgi:hypothetical protein
MKIAVLYTREQDENVEENKLESQNKDWDRK